MQGYDAVLKMLLLTPAGSLLKQVTGLSVTQWLNVEMQQVNTSRADLVGRTADGGILHVELQSTNDKKMALRMAEYGLKIYRRYGKLPTQLVLYVGEKPVRMRADFKGPDVAAPAFSYRYLLIDFREVNGAPLLASSHVEDNVLAILARLQNQGSAIRQILERIACLEQTERKAAVEQFLLISGLRSLSHVVEEEVKKMPVLNDIMDHAVLGPAIRKGRKEGLQEGLRQGLEQGEQKGLRTAARRIVEKRFGKAPVWLESELVKLSSAELESLMLNALEATSLKELFP